MDTRSGSIMLSIISRPASAGIIYSRDVEFSELINIASKSGNTVQEHLVKLYGGDPAKAAESILAKCESAGISIVSVWDDDYPVLLREIYMPPLVLYYMGSLSKERHIAIVGTRGADSCSAGITRKIAAALAGKGITVVSGLALGIDRNAHIGALSAGGSTIAVMPQGIDLVTPSANSDIHRRIIESGSSAVISEYPPGVRSPDKWVFARRNRIISGMSEAVVITQAPVKSGAMITARYAIDQNRDLYACPGNAFDESYGGCHYLIKQGASMLTGIDEFLCGIDPSFVPLEPEVQCDLPMPAAPGESGPADITCAVPDPVMQVIISMAGVGWKDIDEIARVSGIRIDDINMAVTSLEISGMAERMGNRIKIISGRKDFSGLRDRGS